MRVIESRRDTLADEPLRLVCFLRAQWDEQRAPALQALADLGHEVVYVDEVLPVDGYRRLIERMDFDAVLLWGSSLQNLLMTSSGPFFLDEMEQPYVSLWTDNPIKHLFLLKDVMGPMHRQMFVPDSRVIEQLAGLGFDNLSYLPPWHIDSEIFRPVDPESAFECKIGFAATVNAYEAERAKWRNFWDYRMNAQGDGIIDQVRIGQDHVDVYDSMDGSIDPWSLTFSLISHAQYFEQKAVIRELVVEAMQDRPLDIVGIGSAVMNRDNVTLHAGLEWHDLSRFFCSADINLNCTPWPRSCHHRLFQCAASGAFMISDARTDAAELFEPGTEMIYFEEMEELPELIDRYLGNEAARRDVAEASRRRFLAEHTAHHRMAEMVNRLKSLL